MQLVTARSQAQSECMFVAGQQPPQVKLVSQPFQPLSLSLSAERAFGIWHWALGIIWAVDSLRPRQDPVWFMRSTASWMEVSA